ncbi:hypothetical protein ACRALDRAFT_207450 [Sodiomyces alcalophilus JCM 7366]|uniref:uncharacterized protein n=1 Tax=Sodiomyces alcalophilus JCM 7366 TaxID=591952 RepID=UPI0039B6E874
MYILMRGGHSTPCHRPVRTIAQRPLGVNLEFVRLGHRQFPSSQPLSYDNVDEFAPGTLYVNLGHSPSSTTYCTSVSHDMLRTHLVAPINDMSGLPLEHQIYIPQENERPPISHSCRLDYEVFECTKYAYHQERHSSGEHIIKVFGRSCANLSFSSPGHSRHRRQAGESTENHRSISVTRQIRWMASNCSRLNLAQAPQHFFSGFRTYRSGPRNLWEIVTAPKIGRKWRQMRDNGRQNLGIKLMNCLFYSPLPPFNFNSSYIISFVLLYCPTHLVSHRRILLHRGHPLLIGLSTLPPGKLHHPSRHLVSSAPPFHQFRASPLAVLATHLLSYNHAG